MCTCGDFNNDFSVETWRKARKEHVCCECNHTIAAAERYVEMTVGSDGYVGRYRFCAACDAHLKAFNALAHHTECRTFCWFFGGMLAAAQELVEEARDELSSKRRRPDPLVPGSYSPWPLLSVSVLVVETTPPDYLVFEALGRAAAHLMQLRARIRRLAA